MGDRSRKGCVTSNVWIAPSDTINGRHVRWPRGEGLEVQEMLQNRGIENSLAFVEPFDQGSGCCNKRQYSPQNDCRFDHCVKRRRCEKKENMYMYIYVCVCVCV